MCLENCDSFDLEKDMKELVEHKNVLTTIAAASWVVDKGSLEWATYSKRGKTYNVSDVNSKVQALGYSVTPMISCTDINDLRLLFKNPTQFIHDAIHYALKHNYTGYNIDFEPTHNVKKTDVVAYTEFVDLFAQKLHEKNLTLTIDIATWNNFWNYNMLSTTSVDKVITFKNKF